MKNQELNNILESIKNAKRIYRDQAAMAIMEKPSLFPCLLHKVFDIDDPLHIKAAWTFELVCLEELKTLDPYIHQFILGIPLLKHESALRPVSKICSLWMERYLSEDHINVSLSKDEIDEIVSCNFDWLIEEHKVATQVFAMDTLSLFAPEEIWIRQELKSILEHKAESGSSGYKAHARKLLKNL